MLAARGAPSLRDRVVLAGSGCRGASRVRAVSGAEAPQTRDAAAAVEAHLVVRPSQREDWTGSPVRSTGSQVSASRAAPAEARRPACRRARGSAGRGGGRSAARASPGTGTSPRTFPGRSSRSIACSRRPWHPTAPRSARAAPQGSAPLEESRSRIVGALKAELEAWRTRSLADVDVLGLYLDAIALGGGAPGRSSACPHSAWSPFSPTDHPSPAGGGGAPGLERRATSALLDGTALDRAVSREPTGARRQDHAEYDGGPRNRRLRSR
jgi:hypothetical protein